jgi:hypothetical protein
MAWVGGGLIVAASLLATVRWRKALPVEANAGDLRVNCTRAEERLS